MDNKPVEIKKANIGFMAMEVNGRAHDIRLEYCPPGLKAGLVCSATGIVLFATLIAGRALRARRRKGV